MAELATVALLLGLTGLFIDLGGWNPIVIAASLATAIGSTMARAKSSSR